MSAPLEIRRLAFADLPQVVAIERRSFPTPWSLAMFVLELSKASSVCLAARVDGRLVGYLVCSRYDTVWHVMNVAVDPAERRHGVASALLERLWVRIGDPRRPVHAGGAALQLRRAGPLRAPRLQVGRPAPPLLPGQRRGRRDHVAHARDAGRARGGRSGLGVILALETSCDDTCAAVVDAEGAIRANVISSQGVHEAFGGVVPEVASRHHLELVPAVVDDALARAGIGLADVDRVAVTQGPGLVGALLVGLAGAKALAAGRGLPLVPVDHLHGHVAANFLAPTPFAPPFLCLLASGGHTLLARVQDTGPDFQVLGRTLDDAAGEAFDKGARLLGLGFPGGPALSALAREGDPAAFALPTGRGVAGLDFSFAGLKTALLYTVRDLGEDGAAARRADLAASYEHAIVTALMERTERALAETGLSRLAIGGGVAANAVLRERVRALGVEVHVPAPELCTDNAAMIASAARFVDSVAYPDYLGLDVYATGERGL